MMKSIVEENLVSFKGLEQKIFEYVCELGREMTRTMLESYDEELAASRDTKQYWYYVKKKYKLNVDFLLLFTANVIKLSHSVQYHSMV